MKERCKAEFHEEYNYGREQTLREYISEPLTLNQKRKLKRGFPQKNQNFKLELNFKQLLSNPILLIFMPIIATFLTIQTFGKLGHKIYQGLKDDPRINIDYYGDQDILMYWKSLQDAVFSSTIKVMEKHDVDIYNFVNKIQTIMNIGTMITSNNIHNDYSFNNNGFYNSGNFDFTGRDFTGRDVNN